jgi:hypothetical protein
MGKSRREEEGNDGKMRSNIQYIDSTIPVLESAAQLFRDNLLYIRPCSILNFTFPSIICPHVFVHLCHSA